MKKGLRRILAKRVHRILDSNHRPDEEGIKTYPLALTPHPALENSNRNPDEEGVQVSEIRNLADDSFCRAMRFTALQGRRQHGSTQHKRRTGSIWARAVSGNLADRPSLRLPWKTTPATNVNEPRSPDFGAGRATDSSNDRERERGERKHGQRRNHRGDRDFGRCRFARPHVGHTGGGHGRSPNGTGPWLRSRPCERVAAGDCRCLGAALPQAAPEPHRRLQLCLHLLRAQRPAATGGGGRTRRR